MTEESPRDPLDDRLDAALRRSFEPGDPAHAERILAEARRRLEIEQRPGHQRRWPIAFRVAAGLLLAAASVWVIHYAYHAGRAEPDHGYVQRSLQQVYRDDVTGGFKPAWICKTDFQFASTFNRRLKQPLLLAQMPNTVEALGLSYAYALSQRTVYLLANVGNERVIVFVDRAEPDPQPSLDPATQLHLHRKQLGELVLFELSPLPQPHVLEYFYVPDQMPEP